MRNTTTIWVLVASGVIAGCGEPVESNLASVPEPEPFSVTASVTGGDSAAEGVANAALDFEISLSEAAPDDIDIQYETRPGSASADSDYASRSGTITIPSGSLTASIAVAIVDDFLDEPDETVNVAITSVSSGTIATGSASGTIVDNDAEPTLSIASASVVEGNAGDTPVNFDLTMNRVSGFDVSVDFATSDITAIAGEDYTAGTGTVTIPAGSRRGIVTIQVSGDTIDESNETFNVTISNPVNVQTGTATVVGMIVNDDDGNPPPAVVSIADAAAVGESAGGSTLVFPVSLSAASGVDLDVQYQTEDDTAQSGSDYTGVAATVTIPAGETSATIDVGILDDASDEPDESLNVRLLSVSAGGVIGTAVASGNIVDDDDPPGLAIADAARAEGNSGQSNLNFVVTPDVRSGLPITIDFQTTDGTALAGDDYVGASGQLVIPAGATSGTIPVAVIGDADFEPDETFTVSLTSALNAVIGDGDAVGTISNDDGEPELSVADVQVTEGDDGQVAMTFVVSLSGQSQNDVTFDFATTDGSATAPADYDATSGTRVIAAGAASIDVLVQVNGDTEDENNESFQFDIVSATGAAIADGSATGTIVDDDGELVSGLDSRPVNGTCIAPDRPIVSTEIGTEVAFPNLPSLIQPVGLLRAPGDNSQWYVIEKDGRILRFNNASNVSTTSTFIDIRSPSDPIDVDSSRSESGLLGMAFHPDYGNGNWFVYLSYMIEGGGGIGPHISIVSRFESKDNGQTLDATDAVEVLRMAQPFGNHNGGQIAFGPDGLLYIGFGDGGSSGDPGDRAQNTRNLFGSMLRIDVDNGAPYGIPASNPFAGNALCDDGSGSSACPEIFAWGLRNPWKWSFDEPTGQLWVGDVGQNSREEIDIVERGGNYGWRCREGSTTFDTSGVCPNNLIDPVIEYDHGVGNSITGGYVYRGAAIPELAGRYVFADFAQGKLFASVDNGNGTFDYEQLLDTSFLVAAFAQEPNGELLFLNYGAGDIRRLVQSGGSSNDQVATTLSASGCVDPANPSQPAAGLIPYDINAPFWSDGAAKERWYALPDNRNVTVNSQGDWQFPTGSVLMKHFRLNGQLIETRLFMRHTDGSWAGYSYEWNDAGTDADRLFVGKTEAIGGQNWIYPSGAECMQCHTQAAGFTLGPEHGQLNRDFMYPSTGRTANQLVTADAIDVLANPLPDSPDNLPRFADPFDTAQPLDARARAYLHSNCAGCHRPGGPTPSDMDLRHATSLASTNTCDVAPTSGDLGIAGARIVDPGSAATSVLVERTARRDSHGMPPLGSNIVDSGGVQLLADWVNSLASCP